MSIENIFYNASELALSLVGKGEDLILNYSGENTTFVRFNNTKVRQITEVVQGELGLTLTIGLKSAYLCLPFTENEYQNNELIKTHLIKLREQVSKLPDDPHAIGSKSKSVSTLENKGDFPKHDEFISIVQKECGEDDLAGVLTLGSVYRGVVSSSGAKHWFSTSSFSLDYSLYSSKERAVKGAYAGSIFNKNDLIQILKESRESLKVMDLEKKVLSPGKYKVYLTPDAVHEIIGTMSWGGFSGASYKRGNSCLTALADEDKKLSDKFSIEEDFTLGVCPAFNDKGELSKEKIELISEGELKSFLVCDSTEKEFGLESNGAAGNESIRSPKIKNGDLKRGDILEKLGTGLYISNLHYLNWSDQKSGRVTGMTRFGCLWVENGKIVGPIKDMRFDETIYQVFGDGLLEVTDFAETILENSTYDQRGLGGAKVPGMIVENFEFTL